MGNMNNVTIMGRLTANPELRYTANQIATCGFNIAVDDEFSNKSEKKTDFFHVQAWRGTAEFISKYFAKGNMIAILGRLKNREWEKDGVKHHITEIIVNNAYFCESKRSYEGGVNEMGNFNPVNVTVDPQFAELENDGELPF